MIRTGGPSCACESLWACGRTSPDGEGRDIVANVCRVATLRRQVLGGDGCQEPASTEYSDGTRSSIGLEQVLRLDVCKSSCQ
jgi:hypothetical protein